MLPALPWWLSGIVGSVLVVVVSVLRLGGLGASGASNYAWYTTASGRRLQGLILDQVQYLQLTDHFSGRAVAPQIAPFSSRALAPWLAGHLGGDAAVALWAVNAACLVLGTFALARLAMDLTGRREWTLVAVLIWSLSWPVFWYTSKSLVDPAAVGLMVVALCCLYRRWLLPGLVVFVLAVWAKETALVLVPIAIARELLVPRASTLVVRGLRVGAWVVAAAVAYLTAGLLAGGHELTFAPWIPASIPSAWRIISMNLGSVGGLAQFVFTATPAALGLVLWWHGRRSGRAILADHDGVPLAIGIVLATLLSCWSFVSALWDGRTVWMTLPLGALLIAAWCAAREPIWSWRRLVRVGFGAGATLFAVLVVWVVLGALVNRQVTAAAAPALVDIEPRIVSIDRVAQPHGRTHLSGSGDGGFTVDADGPTLVHLESSEPAQLRIGDAPLVRATGGAGSGTVLVDADEPTEVEVVTDGDWFATVLPVSRALFWEALSTLSGDGPQVLVFPGGLVNSTDVAVRADGPVTLHAVGRCRLGECPPLDIGADDVVTVPAGTEVLVVDAEAGWMLVPQRLSPEADALVLEGTRHG